MNASAVSGVAVSRANLVRVFWRSLFLQAAWHPQGMQNLGLAYAVYPALCDLYPREQDLRQAVLRHLSFFNTHPYVAAAIIGGIIHHETKLARGEAPAGTVEAFKAALMGPLAALGDGFFWLSLRPAAGAVSGALVPVLHTGAVLLFVLMYNVVHLTLRAQFFWLGLRQGDGLVKELGRQNLAVRGARLRELAGGCAGAAVAGWAVALGGQVMADEGSPELAVAVAGGCLVLGGVGYLVVRQTRFGYAAMYLVALLAIWVGAAL